MRVRVAATLATLCGGGGRRRRRVGGGVVVCRALSVGRSPSPAPVDVSQGQSRDSALRSADPEAVFVVLGASRGIGAAFVKQLLERTAGTVVASCRMPATAQLPAHDRLRTLPVDLRSPASLAALAAELPRVDCVINCVGVLHAEGRMPERRLADVDSAWLSESFELNCASALFATQALAPALKKSDKTRPPSIVAHLSARVGSISDNHLGGWYSYRISKAALNMMTRTSALELKRQRTICVALHPGTTNTSLSAPFQARVQAEKLFDPAYTTDCLLRVIENLDLDDHTGGFFAYDGSAIPY